MFVVFVACEHIYIYIIDLWVCEVVYGDCQSRMFVDCIISCGWFVACFGGSQH